jgi:lipoate-protein ligase A
LSFEVTRRSGTADALHHRSLDVPVTRRVVLLDVDRAALVLGSTQPDADADRQAAAAQDVEVCRRRSGGGAVLLEPGQTTWIDVEIGRDDPLWDDDVARSSHWLGRSWAAALAELGVGSDVAVHVGGMVGSPWSRQICFAGLGPGEVTSAARKVVGISQRRTREGARFQCVVHRRWDPSRILSLLALSTEDRLTAERDLAGVAAGLDAEPDAVVAAFVRNLP